MSKNKYAISDELWEKIRPYIPERKNTHPRGGGRKPKDDRLVFEAILFVLRYGCQWNALDAAGMCPSSTVHDRFQKWTSEGVFHRLWEAGLLDDGAAKGIDWSWLRAETEEETRGNPIKRRRINSLRFRKERRRQPFPQRLSTTRD